MEFRILGPPQVIAAADPAPVTGRLLTVLSVLLVNHHRPVPMDYLVDAVWDDRPPGTAKRQLQNCVSALRRRLTGGRAIRPPIIHAGPAGYEIRPGPGELDLQVFTDQVADAHALAASGRTAEAAAELRAALALWRGDALLGIRGRIAEAIAAGLHEQRLAAIETCVDLELRLGRHDQLVAELTELVAAHPLRERLVGQLMLALHGCGRQADALSAYQRLRTLLAEDLGLDPGPQVQDLHATLLRHDRTVMAGGAGPQTPRAAASVPAPPAPPAPPAQRNGADPPPPAAHRPASPATSVPRELPPDVFGFTGRDSYLKHLDERLPDPDGTGATVPIAVISGMAGVGKTALAVHWGHRVRQHFPDGDLYLHLRGYAAGVPVRAIDALATFLRALGVPADQIPVEVDAAAGKFRSVLTGRRVLIVLDNAAHVDQVRPLLPASPGCLVLVTSRERLAGLVARDGAGGVTLEVLAADEARSLLARILGPDRVAAEPEASAELARGCAYLPLALRVAAANLTSHPTSITDYLTRLVGDQRLESLVVDGDPQSAVPAAFDLSYQSIDGEARRLFRLIGLLAGPEVSVAAAAALADLPARQAGRLLDRLAAAHLVSQQAPGRYAWHDLLHQYAADRASQEDPAAQREAALKRYLGRYLATADAAARVLYPHRLRLPMPASRLPPMAEFADHAAALAWLDAERASLVAAISHAAELAAHSTAWLLADTLRGYFWLRMHAVDWRHAAQTALAAAQAEGDLPAQAAAQLSLGDLHERQSHFPTAIAYYTGALSNSQRAGWVEGEAAALGYLGGVHRTSGTLGQSAEYFRRALARYRDCGSPYGQAATLTSLAGVYRMLGQLPDAITYSQRALALHRACGSRLGEAVTLNSIGDTYRLQGRLPEAAEHHTRALALVRGLGDRGNESFSLRLLAAVHRDAGRLDQAMTCARAALTLGQLIGDRRAELHALNTIATIHLRLGQHHEAAASHLEALTLARATGDRYPEVDALLGLAAARYGLGQAAEAGEHADRARALAGQAGYRLPEEVPTSPAGRR